MRPLCIALGALLVSVSHGAYCQGQDDRDAQFLLRGLLASREAIRSGDCIAHVVERKNEIECRFAFDYARGVVRFEREDGVLGRSVYVGTPEEVLVYATRAEEINRHAPNTTPIIRGAMPFDLRRIGITGLASYNSDMTFDKLRKVMLSWRAEREVADGVTSLILESPPASDKLKDGTLMYTRARHKFVLEPGDDVNAVTLDVIVRQSTDEAGERGVLEQLNQSTATKWKKLEDVYVPIECEMVGNPKTKPSITKIRFDWRSVNRPVDDSLFTIESLGAPVGTSIINHRMGKPIFEGRLGDPKKLAAMEKTSHVADESGGIRWSYVGIVGAAVLCACCAIVVRRRILERRSG
jgi:hypothetical protein